MDEKIPSLFRSRSGSPYAFDPNLSALADRRPSSSDPRDRNGSVSVSLSDVRRGSNDSVESFASEAPASVNSEITVRKRKPRSLRNSFESLQLGFPDDSPFLVDVPVKTAENYDLESSCEELEDDELVSPSSSLSNPLSADSPSDLSQRLWQELLVSTTNEPRRVRRIYKRRSGCNCAKSKCLKLYCECFAKQAVCGSDCSCTGCLNTVSNPESREKAIQASLDRSTTAFFRSPETGLEHKGCRCKKSNCRKNYCECFSVSRSCTQECRCTDCGNVHGVKLPLSSHTKISPLSSSTALPSNPGFPNMASVVTSKFRKQAVQIQSSTLQAGNNPEAFSDSPLWTEAWDADTLINNEQGCKVQKDDWFDAHTPVFDDGDGKLAEEFGYCPNFLMDALATSASR